MCKCPDPDDVSNSNGEALVEFCIAHNMLVVNGRFGDDRGVGKLTVFNRNGGTSTVDLAIASGEMCKIIRNFEVRDYCPLLSDVHCPIVLTLGVNDDVQICSEENETVTETTYTKFTYDNAIKSNFKTQMDQIDIDSLLTELAQLINQPTQAGMDGFCSKFKEVLVTAGFQSGALVQKNYYE